MHQTSNRFSMVVDSNDTHKNGKKHGNDVRNHSESVGDLSQHEFKHPTSSISREDSISSNKSSLSSLFPGFMKSFDGSSSSGSVIGMYVPRPDKTLVLFETLLAALNEMLAKYLTMINSEDGVEGDYNEICNKLDERINLIKIFKNHYNACLGDKQAEVDKIQSNFRSFLSKKSNKDSAELYDTDSYWSLCRDLYATESKLERCTGKLQFQIMELDFGGKINPLDQYELSIRFSETSKFKTRIRIERNGHQMWDSRNFAFNPAIDEFQSVKFTELKPLNKSVLLVDKRLSFVNSLIKSDPSIYTLWLTPLGTIKLKVIVQWNAMIGDPTLESCLNSIDNKFFDNSSKSEVSVRSRAVSTSHKYTQNRLSVNIESLFRSSRMDNDSRCNSMSNILEDGEEEKSGKGNQGSVQQNRLSNKQVAASMKKNENQDVINNVCVQTHDPEKFAVVQVNLIDENELKESRSFEERSKASLLKQERIDIAVGDDLSINQEKEEVVSNSGKDESLENILSLKDSPPSHIHTSGNGDHDIESPIVTISDVNNSTEEVVEEQLTIVTDHFKEENKSICIDDVFEKAHISETEKAIPIEREDEVFEESQEVNIVEMMEPINSDISCQLGNSENDIQSIEKNDNKDREIIANELANQLSIPNEVIPIIHKEVIDQPIIHNEVIDQPIIINEAIDQPIIINEAIDEPIIHNEAVDQPIIHNEAIDQPIIHNEAVDQPMIQNEFTHQPIIHNEVINQPILPNELRDQPIILDALIDQSTIPNERSAHAIMTNESINQPIINNEPTDQTITNSGLTDQPIINNELPNPSVIDISPDYTNPDISPCQNFPESSCEPNSENIPDN